MLEDGEEFIEAAYLALLKRRPDATGGRTYLRALRGGTSKLQILYELSLSTECLLARGEIPSLADACARGGIGKKQDEPDSAPPPAVTQVMHAEQLLALDDHNELIEIAYWVLLKRTPDLEGIASYLERLKGGTSKTQFLYELFTSAECREIGVELPGLLEAFEREGLDVVEDKPATPPGLLMETAKTLTVLLGHNGGQFVECAYMTLFERAADSQGFEHHLAQLLGGTSKIQILSEMSASADVSKTGVALPGLAAALTQYHLSRTPVLGRFAKFFVEVEGDSVAERRGRATEQRLFILEAKLIERVAQLERSSNGISVIEQQALARRQDVDARFGSLEKSIAGLRQLIERYAHEAPMSVPYSSNTGLEYSAGRIAMDLRTAEIARDIRRVRDGSHGHN